MCAGLCVFGGEGVQRGAKRMKKGRRVKEHLCLFIKANVPDVCKADRQPWGAKCVGGVSVMSGTGRE